eukprot:gene3842-4786_t
MNLSEDVLKGLETLSDEKLIPDANKSIQGLDSIAIKQTYSAFITFILESMKVNSDQNSISNLLEEHKLSNDRIQIILGYFKEYRVSIRKTLSITNFHFPHIIDINWRLDYFMKSNSIEKVNTPVYIVNLTTEQEEGGKGKVEFACTLDQLQDLVFKLRDAQKQIERSSIKS